MLALLGASPMSQSYTDRINRFTVTDWRETPLAPRPPVACAARLAPGPVLCAERALCLRGRCVRCVSCVAALPTQTEEHPRPPLTLDCEVTLGVYHHAIPTRGT